MRWPVTWRNKCARRWPIPSYLVCTVLLIRRLINSVKYPQVHSQCLCLHLLALFCSEEYVQSRYKELLNVKIHLCVCGLYDISGVTRILEPVKEQMHQEIAQKLTATDSIIRDSIGKMVRSKVGSLSMKHQI